MGSKKNNKPKPDDSIGAVRTYSKPLVSSSVMMDPKDAYLKKKKSLSDRFWDLIWMK